MSTEIRSLGSWPAAVGRRMQTPRRQSSRSESVTLWQSRWRRLANSLGSQTIRALRRSTFKHRNIYSLKAASESRARRWTPPGRRRTNRRIVSAANGLRVPVPASCATSGEGRIGNRLRPNASLALLLQPVAFPLDVEGVRVVQQTIENGAGDHV